MARQTQRRTERGFTLIELLVVLVILGLVSAFAAPRVLQYLSSAKRDTAEIQIERLSEVLDLYKLEVGQYPTSDQGLEALIEKPAGVSGWNGPYLKKGREMLTDPWGNRYQYRRPGEHGAFDLFSYGADGEPGGQGENADVTNWSSGDDGATS